MSTLRVFALALFAVAAVALLALGWTQGQPWTAATFVVFFSSRVGRSEVRRRLTRRRTDDAVRRTNQFILVTAAGWLGAGMLALVATMAGEGVEWIIVAPFFLVMGGLNLYIALR